MTMVSVRVDESDVVAIQRWVDELGIDRSTLLRDAIRLHLNRLESERDVDRWQAAPLTDGESALATIADWGPAEDWSDWADAAEAGEAL